VTTRRASRSSSVRADLRRLTEAVAPLQPQRLAITILGGHARNGRLVWSGGLVEALHQFGFSAGAARVALGRLVRSDLLARERDGRFIHYRLTPTCEALMAEGDRRLFSFGRTRRSSDIWTVLWHAIPEEQRLARARLARRMRFLGFGSLQDGTWVAPHNMESEIGELLADMGVTEHSIVLVGRPAQPVDLDVLVRRAWNLQDVARRYKAFIAAVTPFRDVPKRDDQAFLARTLMTDLFRQFPSEDPELPRDPIGLAELREQVLELFLELFSTLEAPAQRHFDALTRHDSAR
jgi:phenylacetic acid degradation operon negative regulatory protein